MHVVVVESPAKAKTINKYLGKDFYVLASYGHVRDLPSKDGSVDPERDFEMSWQTDSRGEKRMKEIVQAVKGADQLYLATDPDREGEAISWHLVEELNRRKVLKGMPVKRVVFNEITKTAVVDAFKHPRELNQELIDAYLARRALDYLVGFTLSPVLWRKLPGSRSAGRVQSVALRLICEREAEIEIFRAQEYWSVDVELDGVETPAFPARLTHLDGKRLDRLDLANEAAAKAAVAAIQDGRRYTVQKIDKKKSRRNPQPPFTTSTLQQEASRKLGFGTSRTMTCAQRLYEGITLAGETVGLISYMRTDGVSMSNEAIGQARNLIASRHGDHYLPSAPRIYKTKAKNAQEAHEAIRPTDFSRTPGEMKSYLSDEDFKLYQLIWMRALASQMESAVLDQVLVDIVVGRGQALLRANGSVVAFDGYLALYQEGKDDEEKDEKDRRLPKLEDGQDLNLRKVTPEQHFTQPPPRYSEASLVKKMEELGIGRPSTYASIVQVLQDRDYVRLDKRRFFPEDRGRVVTAFLSSFFRRYVEYNFTADLEEQLDDISGGRTAWKTVLRQFWDAFSKAVAETKELRISEVIDCLDEELGPHFFPRDENEPGKDPRLCPSCNEGRLGLRLGKTGGFIGCSGYPECRYTRPLMAAGDDADGQGGDLGSQPRQLGKDPETDLEVTLRKGPYGLYVQLGEAIEKGDKPKRASLPKGLTPDGITLETAVSLLNLPRLLGAHDGEDVFAGIGRYGPYVKKAKTFKSIPADEDVLTIGLNRAVDLLSQVNQKAGPLKTVGAHPVDGEPITLHAGRYGPYVKHGRLNASLSKDMQQDALTLEQAVALLAAQAEKKGIKKKPPAKKAATKSATAKATTAKKPATVKKAAGKKAPAKKATAKKPATKKATATKATAKKSTASAATQTGPDESKT